MTENPLLKFILENKLLASAVLLGLVLLIIGLFQMLPGSKSGNQIELVPATSSANLNSPTSSGAILVDISGAVAKPGVYSLAPDARIATAVETAGNFSSEADLAWIAKNLNLAAKLTDGAKIYVPAKGEMGAVSTSQTQMNNQTTSGKININTATQQQLESLPTVGTVTAGKIIANRPYNSVDELLSKKVVGQSAFAKIKDLVSVF